MDPADETYNKTENRLNKYKPIFAQFYWLHVVANVFIHEQCFIFADRVFLRFWLHIIV